MTMVLVLNNEVQTVGLPKELRDLTPAKLKTMGWKKLIGTPKPTEPVGAGYQYVYGAPYVVQDSSVFGSWVVEKLPQPYPSWNWVEGAGWVAPVAKPNDDNDYTWDEGSQSWVAPVNINTATEAELKSLNGVDAVRAQAIIDGRPWSSTTDLATIQGISADMIAGWDITV